jgi:AraC-like DNA-binding protein
MPAMIYRVFPPHRRLACHVACLWYLRKPADASAPPDRVLPDGCMELVFNLRTPFSRADATGRFERQPPAILVGQLSRFMLLHSTTEAEVLAVRFAPAGGHAIFRLDLDEITDRHVALENLGGPWRELAARIADAPTLAARVRLLEEALLRRCPPGCEADPRAAAAAGLLAASETPPRIAAVAGAVGLSERQLERRFRREVGLTPRHFARLARFRRMLGALDRADPRWADLAARAGYSDQPHLVREFREFSGLAPRACLAGQTAFAAALLE